MRPVASIAAALTSVVLTLSVASAAFGAPAVIGPPPATTQPRTSVQTVTKAEAQAQLAKQRAAYEKQIAVLKGQVSALKSQVSTLSAHVTELEGADSSTQDEVASLTALNESLRGDYTKLFEARNADLATIDDLTAENKLLTARVASIRPPIARDWLDWAALAIGLLIGGAIGLYFGIRRGEDRATGGGIPANVSAWWGEPEGPTGASKSA